MEILWLFLISSCGGGTAILLTNLLCTRRGVKRLRPLPAAAVFTLPFLCALLPQHNFTSSVYTIIEVTLLTALAATDAKTRRIPNSLLLSLLALQILLLLSGYSQTTWTQSLIGLGAGLVLFLLPTVFHMPIGEGDVKLAATAGFLAGIYGLAAASAVMAVGMLFCGILLHLLKKGGFRSSVPLGPFLAVGLILAMTPLL